MCSSTHKQEMCATTDLQQTHFWRCSLIPAPYWAQLGHNNHNTMLNETQATKAYYVQAYNIQNRTEHLTSGAYLCLQDTIFSSVSYWEVNFILETGTTRQNHTRKSSTRYWRQLHQIYMFISNQMRFHCFWLMRFNIRTDWQCWRIRVILSFVTLWKLQLVLCVDQPIFVRVQHPENELGLFFAHLKPGQLVEHLPELLRVQPLLVHDVLKVVHVGEEALEGLETLGAACVDFQLPELNTNIRSWQKLWQIMQM